jgi:hypothetical protein
MRTAFATQYRNMYVSYSRSYPAQASTLWFHIMWLQVMWLECPPCLSCTCSTC